MADPYRGIKDFMSGTAGGITQVLIGMPLDILKVRLQTTQQYSGTLDCARRIYKNEGVMAFYKGTLTPLLGIGVCVSVQFWAFHDVKRRFMAYNDGAYGVEDLSYNQFYMSGAAAGVASSVITSPVEQVRILLQTQPDKGKMLYNGPLDCVRKISAHQGIAKGVFRGLGVTSVRDAQGYGVWFLTYEFLMRQTVQRGTKREDVPTWKLLAYGAIAGEMLWLSSYPLDVVKSRIQADGFAASRKYYGFLDCARTTWIEGGTRAFWKGIVPTALRATPASAGTFATVELAMRLLG